jgi:endonuclease/exonuclease/phosphatase family metal-dependent hydrolase
MLARRCRPDATGIHIIRPSILRCDVTFRLLTLNLWNISEPLEPRYHALAAGLKRLRPEIVCLQEVYSDPKSGRSQAELVGEMCRLSHRVGENGLSILSSQPVVRSAIEPLPQMPDDPPRQVLLAEFAMEGHRLLVINTHLAYQPKMVEGRRKQAQAMLEAIKRHTSKPGDCPKVLCGDFNDVADSPAIRLVLKDEIGFRDAFAKCHPRSRGLTYSPTRNPYVDPTWTENQRIDYIFLTRGLRPKNCSVVFDGTRGLDFVSDHFGVFCNVQFSGRRARDN